MELPTTSGKLRARNDPSLDIDMFEYRDANISFCNGMRQNSGPTTASCFVSQNGASNKTAPYQPGSVTPAAGQVIVTGINNGLGSGPTSIDSSFTDLRKNDSYFTFGAAYLLPGNATPVNPTWTTATASSDLVIAVFQAA
jgi:hypothetical protein